MIENGNKTSGKNIKQYVYVCPHCFNKVENCECPMLPYELIQIDKNIWPSIKVLNNKWYFTESCCEGHIEDNPKPFIYIMFRKNQKFKTVPDGFKDLKGCIKAEIIGKSDEAKKRKKRALLKSLYEWACELESRRPGNCPIF